MKTKIIILAISLFSLKTMAQSAIIQPELFRVPTANSLFNVCLKSGPGKIFLVNNSYAFTYCNNASNYSNTLLEKWEANGSSIYHLGKVKLATSNETYELEIGQQARIQTLMVDGNVGINTTTPTEKLELKDRDINIISSADAKAWKFRNLEAADRFDFLENGQATLSINYGGNVGVGNIPNTDKLKVNGNVAYAGSLSVEGKGTLANTDASQLVMQLVTSQTTGGTFSIANNTCGVVGFNFGSNQYTNPPVVILGQNTSLTEHGPNLVKSVDSVTTTGGSIRVCNNTGGVITFSNQTYSLIAIGQL